MAPSVVGCATVVAARTTVGGSGPYLRVLGSGVFGLFGARSSGMGCGLAPLDSTSASSKAGHGGPGDRHRSVPGGSGGTVLAQSPGARPIPRAERIGGSGCL